jgi:nitrilase
MNAAQSARPPAEHSVRVAAVQMVSTPRVDDNLRDTETLIGQAAGAGAQLVALPEYFCLMGHTDTDKVAAREADGKGPIQDFLSTQARRH